MIEFLNYRDVAIEKDANGAFWVLLGTKGKLYHETYEAALKFIDYLRA